MRHAMARETRDSVLGTTRSAGRLAGAGVGVGLDQMQTSGAEAAGMVFAETLVTGSEHRQPA